MIALYRLLSGMEKEDKGNVLVLNERETRGHRRTLKTTTSRKNIKKFSLPYKRNIEACNGLKGEVEIFMT